MALYHDLIEAIGNTPLVELPRSSPNPKVRLYAKLGVHSRLEAVARACGPPPGRWTPGLCGRGRR